MINRHNRGAGRAIGATLLVATLGACDFIEPTEADPNKVPTAGADQLFTAIQVNSFYLSESIYARVASMWTQQTAGVTSQFTQLDQYDITEDDTDVEMASHYIGGGLIDVRKAVELTNGAGRQTYAGILKVYEAWFVGTAADIYGDVPYSEAVGDIVDPKLDPQLEVYTAVQAKLDEAITDLQSARGVAAGAVDLNFGGNAQCWTQVARSLKARYFMHLAEVQGNAAYQAALANAQQGISSNACNWRAIHSNAATENNIWFQFQRDRDKHIVGGFTLVNFLNGGTPAITADDDPRLALYFTPATDAGFVGQYLGSRPGAPAGDVDEGASQLNTGAGGVVSAGFDQPFLSCAETQFIIAEAQFRLGNQAAARTAGNAGIACEAGRLGVTLAPISAAASDQALLDQILRQKYIALFLNIETWADYQRTCYPRIQTFGGEAVPGRLYYGSTERQTNKKIPDVGQQRLKPRNANDPNACPSA